MEKARMNLDGHKYTIEKNEPKRNKRALLF